MALRINTNVAALNSHRQLLNTEVQMNKSMQKLSSGYRINNAGDDASGLVQANALRTEVRVLKVEAQNTLQQRAALSIEEGDVNTVENIVERMAELLAKGDPGGGETEAEFDALAAEIDRIATESGNASINSTNLGVNAYATADTAGALSDLGAILGDIGAEMNTLDFTYANIQTKIENTSASESAIRDVDMAAEMVNFTKSQIMLQAGTAMLAQANMSSQGVLSLFG